jgi:Tfp pilus assembly protein PilF
LIRLGEVYSKEDDKINEAEEMLVKAIQKEPENAEAHVVLGKVYEKLNKVDEAILCF